MKHSLLAFSAAVLSLSISMAQAGNVVAWCESLDGVEYHCDAYVSNGTANSFTWSSVWPAYIVSTSPFGWTAVAACHYSPGTSWVPKAKVTANFIDGTEDSDTQVINCNQPPF